MKDDTDHQGMVRLMTASTAVIRRVLLHWASTAPELKLVSPLVMNVVQVLMPPLCRLFLADSNSLFVFLNRLARLDLCE